MADEEPPEADPDRYIVPGLERGLRILALFTAQRPEWSLSMVAREMGISRSSVFRLMFTLEASGFLRRVGERQFRLGPKILSLGFNFVAGQDVVEVARPTLERLRDRVGASAHLGVLDQDEVLYLLRAPSRQTVISNIGVGSRLPAMVTTMGRALLTGWDEAALAGLHRRAVPPADLPVSDFLQMIAGDRDRGFVAAVSSFERGIVSVAAPVRDQQGGVVAAINISAPETVLPMTEAEHAIPLVRQAAAEISHALGHTLHHRS